MFPPFLVAAATLALLLATGSGLSAQTSGATEATHGTSTAAAGNGAGEHMSSAPAVRALPLTAPVTIDGRLDEEIWRSAAVATDFRQREPEEGAPATQRTEVRFAYDAEALYIGARMYDDLGAEGVVTRLVRRDADPDSDYLMLYFDTFHDHLGRTQLAVNPSGVRLDAYAAGAAGLDASWDPVWELATRVDSLGWTAELRIPFSQLRFSRADEQMWGLQIERRVSRLNELSVWSFWRQNETGGPSRYGHLQELGISARPQRAEIIPYVVGRTAHVEPRDPTDPFQSSSVQDVRVGADMKVLLTSNLTLDAAINPDFGQVEVDPAVVNLSAFETFFPERRPFFVEGSGVFGFGSFNCWFCSNVSSLSLFYSRRIGRAPQGGAIARGAGDYSDVPSNTTILGAAKITGRTQDGYSVGVLNALTRREVAPVIAGGERSEVEVEPLTNYFVGRLRKDMRDGNLVVGGILTSVYRDLDTPEMAGMLNRHAESAGVDAQLWWGDRNYRLLASLATSQISGEPEAILRAQRSSARYFQRPDREPATNGIFTRAYDPELEVMRGYGGYARVAKEGGDLRFESQVNFRSPGFEVNDLAFLSSADYFWMSSNVNRQFTSPTRYFRRLDLTAGAQQQFTFDGDMTGRQVHAWAGTQTPFYWWMSAFYLRQAAALSGTATRGGPMVMTPEFHLVAGSISTDSRKTVVLGSDSEYGWNPEGGGVRAMNVSVRVRPASNVSVSVSPSYMSRRSTTQYVTTVEDPTASHFWGRRYVFADLDQKTLAMNTRLNVTFTPSLSLELFAQPFISTQRYSSFKEYDEPRALERSVYGSERGTITSEGEGFGRRYRVDPDGEGPAGEFSFGNPDFNLRSLRGNAVFRWEYRPGSTLFLVWTQSRSDIGPEGELAFGRDRSALFAAKPDNIFMVKASYWLGL